MAVVCLEAGCDTERLPMRARLIGAFSNTFVAVVTVVVVVAVVVVVVVVARGN